ncbi:transcriptional regulator [Kaistia sp. 32K]|uniref:helix-turn-helix transcriptional regulator n=1 Tax=Kaistia sp. 32K TaxID=2795690 RepID=UPI001916A906|nr:helix-turn-helix transcriptional regulator [Kaistia sp. 32K]BCP55641.1 transcriptional regulator [Kaistia sp. 32K]
MIPETETVRRQELGEFVRAHRERLQPSMFGLEPGRRRRTPGLRREELAQLSGVGATWLSWIEQGRDIAVSANALARLARVMRLTPAERAYLFDLGGRRDPQAAGNSGADALPAGLAATLEALPTPAYVLDRSWTAIAWNAAAAHLFTGWLHAAASAQPTAAGDETVSCENNLLRYIFRVPAARHVIHDWETRARRVAAEFRADYSRHLESPEMRALVEELSRASPFFAEAWEAHAVVDREGGLRTFDHPEDGFLRYEQATFLLAHHPDIKLVLLTPLFGDDQAATAP